jgi:hypothetical protein
MPSRPGEFHPEPLIEPDVSLATHPARATQFLSKPAGSSCRQLTKPSSTRVAHPLRSPSITLVPHYYGVVRPCRGASVLSASRVVRLGLFPSHRPGRFSSSVRKPRGESRPYTPDTAGPRGRLPSCSSRGSATTPVLMPSFGFFGASSVVRFHSSLSPSPDVILATPFDPNVHHRGF